MSDEYNQKRRDTLKKLFFGAGVLATGTAQIGCKEDTLKAADAAGKSHLLNEELKALGFKTATNLFGTIEKNANGDTVISLDELPSTPRVNGQIVQALEGTAPNNGSLELHIKKAYTSSNLKLNSAKGEHCDVTIDTMIADGKPSGEYLVNGSGRIELHTLSDQRPQASSIQLQQGKMTVDVGMKVQDGAIVLADGDKPCINNAAKVFLYLAADKITSRVEGRPISLQAQQTGFANSNYKMDLPAESFLDCVGWNLSDHINLEMPTIRNKSTVMIRDYQNSADDIRHQCTINGSIGTDVHMYMMKSDVTLSGNTAGDRCRASFETATLNACNMKFGKNTRINIKTDSPNQTVYIHSIDEGTEKTDTGVSMRGLGSLIIDNVGSKNIVESYDADSKIHVKEAGSHVNVIKHGETNKFKQGGAIHVGKIGEFSYIRNIAGTKGEPKIFCKEPFTKGDTSVAPHINTEFLVGSQSNTQYLSVQEIPTTVDLPNGRNIIGCSL